MILFLIIFCQYTIVSARASARRRRSPSADMLEQFVDGVASLLEPSSLEAKVLAAKLAQGAKPSFVSDFGFVKSIGIVGAGVAGLQAANLMNMVGFKVVVSI